jgi:tRNA threonylcarbamoyl adenosine modification protein (Sua5/YciO/YrdC/YwlC family)
MVTPDDAAQLAPLLAALGRGAAVAVPTDTVYGIATLPVAPATGRLFALKDRPDDVAIAVLVADLETAVSLTAAGRAELEILGARFWPGALTVVCPRRPDLGFDLGGDPMTIGLRCPAHALLRALLGETGPLAVTSANRHGDPPARTAAEVRLAFGAELLCLDGGTMVAPPSTVVALEDGAVRLLRAGAVEFSEVERALSDRRGAAGGDN